MHSIIELHLFLHKLIDPDTHKKCNVTDIYNYVEKYELSSHGHSLLREKQVISEDFIIYGFIAPGRDTVTFFRYKNFI